MVNISKSENSIKFVFTDSDHYLYKDGVVDVPVNSLSLVIDESEMVTFKKASTADPFISFRLDKSNFSSRDELLTFYKENMVGAGGISEEEVQEMIDAATSGKADTSAVTQSLSAKQDALQYYTEDTSSESATIEVYNNDGAGNKTESRVFVDGRYIFIEKYNETDDGEGNTGTTDTQVDINPSGLSISASSDDGENESRTELEVKPMGAYINSEPIATEPYVDAATSGKADTSAVTAVNGALTTHTADTTVHVSQAEKATWNAKADASAITSIESSITAVSNDLNTLSGAVIDNEYTVSQAINELKSTKQATLVSGTNIKTINNESILGSGNIEIQGGGGGMDDDTQQLISTALNDLNDRKADLTELSKYQKKGDYVVTSTLADYMTNASFDEYATAKERIISGALNDLNDKFGGLRLVKISQAEYDALATKDSSTLYIISD